MLQVLNKGRGVSPQNEENARLNPALHSGVFIIPAWNFGGHEKSFVSGFDSVSERPLLLGALRDQLRTKYIITLPGQLLLFQFPLLR